MNSSTIPQPLGNLPREAQNTSEAMPMPENEYQEMRNLEESLWWYRILHLHIARALEKSSIQHGDHVLDLGCGTGGTLQHLIDLGYKHLNGIDLSQTALKICRERGLSVEQGDIKDLSPLPKQHFQAVICSDVLTYLPSALHSSRLEEIRSLLKEDGILIFNMPAHKYFSGIHDLVVGTVERTKPRVFLSQLKEAGFLVDNFFSWPLALSPIILLVRAWQRLVLKLNRNPKMHSDVRPVPLILNNVFFMVTKCELLIPRSLRFFGSSFFVVCKKN